MEPYYGYTMTPAILSWLRAIRPLLPDKLTILEVGSLNVNGSPRSVFLDHTEYVGIDVIAGMGVDVVLDAHNLLLHFKDQKFNVVICCEMLEHDNNPMVTADQMRELVARS